MLRETVAARPGFIVTRTCDRPVNGQCRRKAASGGSKRKPHGRLFLDPARSGQQIRVELGAVRRVIPRVRDDPSSSALFHAARVAGAAPHPAALGEPRGAVLILLALAVLASAFTRKRSST